MDDLTPLPIPTGRQIIKFAPDAHPADIYGAIESTTGLTASLADEDQNDVDVPVLHKLKIAVGELGGEQLRSLADDDRVLETRPEFYMFDATRLDAESLEWLRTGARMFLEGLELEEEPSPDPFPWEEQAAHFTDTQEMTWGLQAIGAERTALTGAGVKVCVLDTGVDYKHPDFACRSVQSKSFVHGEDSQDGNGHGTHCAGTIAGPCSPQRGRRYGVAPGVDLFVGKVLCNTGSGREFDILSGIEWAIKQGCHIISMSLGRAVRRNEKPDPIYEAVGRAALDAGCLIIAAAGNSSSRRYGYVAPVGSPANAETIMAVGAVDPLMKVSSFSCGSSTISGGEVDVVAPGSDVYSAWPVPRENRTISGTSMACPHVSGVAALLAQDLGVRGKELWQAIIKNTKKLGNANDFGAGLVQVSKGCW